MREIVLTIDPSLWNVVKFIVFSIITLPIIETCLHSLISSVVTKSVRQGRQLQLFDSRLGILALHSKYAGSRRNRLPLVCCALFTLSTQLSLEYSFSSAEVDLFQPTEVWQGPTHHARYFGENSLIEDEPTRFLDAIARQCIDGPRGLNRSQNEIPGYPQVNSKLTYDTTFRIRMPYMRRDTFDVACGTAGEVRHAYVMVPSIVEAAAGFEGVDSTCQVDPFFAFPPWFLEVQSETFSESTSFNFEGVRSTVFLGRNTVCIQAERDATCVISNGTDIAIGKALAIDPARFQGTILRCIRMFISGSGMQQLHEPGRKVRLLAHLSETRLFQPKHASKADKWISPSKLEQVAQVALVVANEAGVVGVEESASVRDVLLPEKRNVTTVSVLGFIPASVLLLTPLILAGYDAFVRMSIARMESRGKAISRGIFSHSRVDMSIDWLRDRVAADLTRAGHGVSSIDDVKVRLVGHGETCRIQVLPDAMARDVMYD